MNDEYNFTNILFANNVNLTPFFVANIYKTHLKSSIKVAQKQVLSMLLWCELWWKKLVWWCRLINHPMYNLLMIFLSVTCRYQFCRTPVAERLSFLASGSLCNWLYWVAHIWQYRSFGTSCGYTSKSLTFLSISLPIFPYHFEADCPFPNHAVIMDIIFVVQCVILTCMPFNVHVVCFRRNKTWMCQTWLDMITHWRPGKHAFNSLTPWRFQFNFR